jgi:2-succinyl-5-enolpyruvyl-6-hydroxy-3-cyclohexene-1-carboxylate synthase
VSPGAAARLAAEALVRALVDAGVAHAVIAPGSRSAPLVLALERLVREGATLGLHTIVDERAAAFFALGLARVSGRPALVCTTSGTAGAHALPAVIEADRDRLPLLVLTADRPPELHGVGAPQTVAQTQMFAPYVRLSADPGAPDAATSLAALATLAARAVAAALGAEGGPVHLNLPYREPLELADPPAPVGGFRPPPRVVQGPARLPGSEVAALARRLCQCERGVLVSGPGDLPASGAPLAERAADLGRALAGLSGALGWPLVADSTSAARGHAPTEALVVTAADLLVRGAPFEATPPELVLRFGQVPTSRALTQWLARPAVGETWLVDPSGRFQDPDHRATGVLAADPARLADDLTAAIRELGHRPRPQWAAAWREAQAVADQRLAEAADADAGLWAGSVARAVVEALPAGGLLARGVEPADPRGRRLRRPRAAGADGDRQPRRQRHRRHGGDRARRGRGLGRRAGGGAAGRPGLPSRPERAGGVPAAEIARRHRGVRQRGRRHLRPPAHRRAPDRLRAALHHGAAGVAGVDARGLAGAPRARARVRGHRVRQGRGHRAHHHQPARGAQRLPARRRCSSCQAAFADAKEDPAVGVVVLTGKGDLAFCSGGDQRVRGDQGYVGADGVPRLNVLELQRRSARCPSPWSRWSPATPSAAATCCTWCAT